MAKYLITYKCGHEVTKQLYGKIKERESYISWAEEQLCPECQRKMRHDEALADAEMNGYPQLDGSEKQVAWAIDLRYIFVMNVESEIKMKRERIKHFSESDEEKNIQLSKFEKLLPDFRDVLNNLLTDKTSAKYWIDNRKFIDPDKYEWDCSHSSVELVAIYEKEKEKEKEMETNL